MTDYSLFQSFPDVQPALSDNDAVTLGTQFSVTGPAWLTAIRYPHAVTADEFAQRTAALYKLTDLNWGVVATGPLTMPVPVAGEWCVVELPTPFQLEQGASYRVAVLHPGGHYPATGAYFKDGPGSTEQDFGPLHLPNMDNVAYYNQGSFFYGTAMTFPDKSFNGASYFSDVVVSDVDPALAGPRVSLKTLESGLWATHSATPKVFSAGAWVPKAPKRWDGTGWVNL
jgi:hypothetical protein